MDKKLRMSKLFKRYQETSEQTVLLSYKGRLSFDLVQLFIDQIEKSLDRESLSLPSKRKIFNVIVEVFQNLTHHIDQETNESVEDEYKLASLKVWIEEDTCYIATGNYVENDKVKTLEKWLTEINTLNSEELRELYKKILNNNTFSNKGGGGLGFLDISRKSGSKMVFNFEKVNDLFTYFNFEIKVNIHTI